MAYTACDFFGGYIHNLHLVARLGGAICKGVDQHLRVAIFAGASI